MCTVTFIPTKDSVLLTSSRDEQKRRSTAAPPQEYEFPTGKMWFPKDRDAGGSWIAVQENGNAIVLLNGGFEKHIPDPPYEKSRGLVLIDLMASRNPYDHFRSYNLENIEPFTLVIWAGSELSECRWDGERKHSRFLDKSIPYIWSSATLYSGEVVTKRQQWFDGWMKDNNDIALDDILQFHQFTGDGDKHNDLLMNRDGQVFTVSITGMEIAQNRARIKYLDLVAGTVSEQTVCFKPVFSPVL